MNLYSILNIFLFISLSVASTDTPPKCQHFIDTYKIKKSDCTENDNGEVTELFVYYIILHLYLIIKKCSNATLSKYLYFIIFFFLKKKKKIFIFNYYLLHNF